MGFAATTQQHNFLHPAASVLIWLLFAIAVQAMSAILLLSTFITLCLLGLLCVGNVWWSAWCTLIRRSFFLLLMLWVITAYSAPGEAWRDIYWMPNFEGGYRASVQVLRLLFFLGSVAFLWKLISKRELLSAVLFVCTPLHFLGLNVQQIVVRLLLVVSELKILLHVKSWRNLLDYLLVEKIDREQFVDSEKHSSEASSNVQQMLDMGVDMTKDIVKVTIVPWRQFDIIVVLVTGGLLWGAIVLT